MESIEWPTPTLARVTLAVDGFNALEDTDAYVNVAIPPLDAPYAAPFDLDALKDLPREQRPFRRRLTVRDSRDGRLTLEIVVHDGPVGNWARGAQPGDALVFTGPAGGYRPDPTADWHLLVGDESALPAIAASLEVIDAPAVVRLVCDGPEYEVPLAGDHDLVWVHRDGSLLESVQSADFPAGRAHAFIHGEAAETRAVRRHLLAERGFDPAWLSCSPYWRRGMTDEEWRAVKAAWNADVANDV